LKYNLIPQEVPYLKTTLKIAAGRNEKKADADNVLLA
jgi:hypothetical protein